jgi:hypothetical protein
MRKRGGPEWAPSLSHGDVKTLIGTPRIFIGTLRAFTGTPRARRLEKRWGSRASP